MERRPMVMLRPLISPRQEEAVDRCGFCSTREGRRPQALSLYKTGKIPEVDPGGSVPTVENDEQPTSANYGIEDHLFDSENESAVLSSPIPWISCSGSKGNKVEQVADIKGSSIIPSTPASPTLPSPRHLSPSPSFSSDTSKPKIIYKSKASPPPPPDYLKHEHGNHATARRLKEELKNSSRRECRDATNDITSPRNEQADNCGEDVAEASGGATEETSNHEAGGGEANEVDKKADEFIARFREQIRLQRIESIKRSTKQRSNKKQQVM
ncbi:hypothetical protein ZIOFF_014711 [Zingiber officinale]|uniref:Uncharacterized protein n=1 Tax=Zingiber officinale TaxID=94328 RepID=A0A8J5HHS0_ZINOF|nr:hypothetical protein ZIOFF_014711 [Zingiber officinale]